MLKPSDVLIVDPTKEIIFLLDRTIVLDRAELHRPPTIVRHPTPPELRNLVRPLDGKSTVEEAAIALEEEIDPESVLEAYERLLGVVLAKRDHGITRRALEGPLVWIGNEQLAIELKERCALETDQNHPADSVKISGARLVICALENVPLSRLIQINRACLAAKVPCLFVTADAQGVTLGPLVIAGKTPCFECSRLRLIFGRQPGDNTLESVSTAMIGGAPLDDEMFRGAFSRAVRIAGTDVEAVLSGSGFPRTLATILRVGLHSFSTLAIPFSTQCRSCGGGIKAAIRAESIRPPAARPIDRSPKLLPDRTTTARSVSTEEARRRALAAAEKLGLTLHVSEYSSRILKRYPELKDLPGYTHVELERSFIREAPIIPGPLRKNIFGKGATRDQALCSALFEFYERHLSEFRGGVEIVRAAYRDVADRAIDMRTFTEGLIDTPDRGEKIPFDESKQIDWVWGYDVADGNPRLLPAVALFMSGAFHGSEFLLPIRGSSGIAAGCTLIDAVLQGLYEVIEHDCWFAAARSGAYLPAVDLKSIDDPATRAIIDCLESAGLTLKVRLISNDTEIPAFEAYAQSTRDLTYHHSPGYGCHHDPGIALRRALLETLQNLGAADATKPQTLIGGYFSVFNSFQDILYCSSRISGVKKWSDIPKPAPNWDRAADYLDDALAKLKRAVPHAHVSYYDFSIAELEGVFVSSVFVTGLYDTWPQVPFFPHRLRNYRRIVEGPHAPLLELPDLYLGELKT